MGEAGDRPGVMMIRRQRRVRLLSLWSLLVAIAASASLIAPKPAEAFCGFYVSGADGKLFNDATQVVLMRSGTKTVLSMQNDYKGPPKDFALVVPVPVVLQKENVKTLSPDVFKRIDTLSSPRLVEYWEQDPCPPSGGIGLGSIGTIGHGAGTGTGQGFGRGALETTVKVEAQFEVGEYEIVILSAEDSGGLDRWLRENKYKIPENAEPALRPYVAAGSKFFVAKVNIAKVKFDANGRASLSPLRFHYDTEKFELPVKLGLLNSAGVQDLIVHVIASDRYEVANYSNVTIPTNLDVTEAARGQFGAFYTSLFDRTVEKNKGAVVTEYSWGATSCDPCPGVIQGMTGNDLASLGADVMPNMTVRGAAGNVTLRQGETKVTGKLPVEVIQRIVRQNFGRFRLCYENGLRSKPTLSGKVGVRFEINKDGGVENARDADSDLPDASVTQCITRGFGNLSFPAPEDGKKVSVLYPITFASNGSNMSVSVTSGGSLILTRLHARYSKDALGSDLVFRKADAIVGGREAWSEGKLETGAVKSPSGTSTFQGRYAIRHPWRGKIACKEPQRGVWGGPPSGKEPSPLTATKLAYAPRGGTITLASFTSPTAPALDNVLTSSPSDVSAALLGSPSIDAGTSDASALPSTSEDAGVAADAGHAPSSPPQSRLRRIVDVAK